MHVPHGDLKTANHVSAMTSNAGLTISAYGSYYRLTEADSPDFEAVSDTASILGTDIMRVWENN